MASVAARSGSGEEASILEFDQREVNRCLDLCSLVCCSFGVWVGFCYSYVLGSVKGDVSSVDSSASDKQKLGFA